MTPLRRILAAALLTGAGFGASGCWTGFAWQAARQHESVTRYTAAFSDGESLLLRYEVAVTDADGSLLSHEPRAARIALADLAATPRKPVDTIPVRALPVPPPLGVADRPLPIARDLGESDGSPADGVAGPPPPLLLRVQERDEAESGLELHPLTPGGAPAAAGAGFLDSDVLYRDRLAWWMAPALPLAGAFDVLILPFQLLTAWPFFVVGD